MTLDELASFFRIRNILADSVSIGCCPNGSVTNRFAILRTLPGLYLEELQIVAALYQCGILPHVQKLQVTRPGNSFLTASVNIVTPGWEPVLDLIRVNNHPVEKTMQGIPYVDFWFKTTPLRAINVAGHRYNVGWSDNPDKETSMFTGTSVNWARPDEALLESIPEPMQFAPEQEYLVREIPVRFEYLNYQQ